MLNIFTNCIELYSYKLFTDKNSKFIHMFFLQVFLSNILSYNTALLLSNLVSYEVKYMCISYITDSVENI